MFEGDETFSGHASNASGATIADAIAVGTIVNDDRAPDEGHMGNGEADTFAITWAWGTNKTIDFDTALDTLDFSWMAKDGFSIAESNGSTVITIARQQSDVHAYRRVARGTDLGQHRRQGCRRHRRMDRGPGRRSGGARLRPHDVRRRRSPNRTRKQPSRDCPRCEAAMKRPAPGALASGAVGDVQRQEVLVGRMGLPSIGGTAR